MGVIMRASAEGGGFDISAAEATMREVQQSQAWYPRVGWRPFDRAFWPSGEPATLPEPPRLERKLSREV